MFWTGNQCIFLKALGQEDQRLQHGRKHPESEFAIGFHIVKCHELARLNYAFMEELRECEAWCPATSQPVVATAVGLSYNHEVFQTYFLLS